MSLEARGLRTSFRSGFSLDVGTLAVPAGTTLALLGPSGSGKSTLLALLGLLEKPEAGEVLIDGRVVDARDRQARLMMAAVFQRPYLIKGTVAANVEYGLRLRRVPAEERARLVDSVLARVGLEGMGPRSAAALSGGEAQRVALARALVLTPRVLLLDEPLASLDPLLKRKLASEFAEILRREGVTVVWVTHDHEEALVVAERVAVMNAGRIVAEGPASTVMSLPADAWTAGFLGVEVPLVGRVESVDEGVVCIAVGETLVRAMGAFAPGEPVRLSIPPEDVVLLTPGDEPLISSARNRLDVSVSGVEPRGASMRLTLERPDVRFAAIVSRTSFDELGLGVGARVGALFKASAVRVVAIRSEGTNIPGAV